MHRHVRRVRHQRAVVGEHRAGEVEPLLDVHRVGGVLQRDAHLLGDRHEQVVEHLEHDRIGPGADGAHALQLHDPRQHQMIFRGDGRLPAGLDHDGLVRLDHDRRPLHLVAGGQLVAGVDGRVVPFAVGEEFCPAGRRGELRPRRPVLLLLELRPAADRFDRDRLDDEVLLAIDEAELRLVGLLERGFHRHERAGLDHQRGVGAGVADVRAHEHRDGLRADALAGDLPADVFRKLLCDLAERGERFCAERFLDRLLARRADVGEAHAVGGQQRGERMDQHRGHAERVGHQTRVLAAGSAKAIERIARHVIAALHGNLLDRVRHVLHGDLDEAVGDRFRRLAADLPGKVHKCALHGGIVERLVLVRPKNFRKKLRHQLAGHDVRIRDRKRPAAAVALRPRIGAGRVRPDAKARAVEMQDRAAAGRDGVDQHHRRAHAHAGDLGLEGALVLAVIVRHVGRGAAHVEADQAVEAGFASGLGHADHAAGGAGQDRILALEELRGSEATG